MIDASGTVLPADALHPLRTCTDCKRIMLRKRYQGPVPEGAVVFAAHGRCNSCYALARRGACISTTSATRDYITDKVRGLPMTVEQSRSGLDHFLAARRRRLERSRRRSLASALSAGWEAAR